MRNVCDTGRCGGDAGWSPSVDPQAFHSQS